MRARKAREQGCIVVWDKGKNPCDGPVIRDLLTKNAIRDAKRKGR